MDNNRKIILYVAAIAVCFAILLASQLLTKGFSPSVGSFAVDSSGRVYIHYDVEHAIHVYQDGAFLYDLGNRNDLAAISKRGIRFVITEEDQLHLLDGNTLYILDLEGNLLQTVEDAYNKGKNHSIESHDGVYKDVQRNTYEIKGKILGRTRVIKNGAQEVFAISNLSFGVRIAKTLAVVGFVSAVIAFLYIYWKNKRDWG